MTSPDASAGQICPLCGAPDTPLFHRDPRRPYHRCPACALVFVPAAWHLSAAAEKAQYDLHENALDDPGYRRFLSRIAAPVLARARPGSHGIDVGCGPAPLLARMLEEGGLHMRVYDPCYAPDPAPLATRYAVVTASEVVEHFRRPAEDFARLVALMQPGALLAVMTKRVRDPAAFARWHYILDPTHVAFYHAHTFQWLAARHGLAPDIAGDDVVVFTRPADDNATMIPDARERPPS